MIFNFSNYGDFLNSYLASLPMEGHGEARRIAKHLEVSSTYISQILKGAKILSPELGESLSEYLGLTELESEYFFYLIQAERAGTVKLKKFCRVKLEAIKSRSLNLSKRVSAKRTLTDHEVAIFYSSPLYSAIHLYTSTGEHGRTLEEISKRFSLPRTKASGIVQFLVETSFVTEKNGLYKMGSQSTHLEQNSPHMQRHHSVWRERAIQASEELNESELMYTANVSLSLEDFSQLREKMVIFIKDFLDQVHKSPAEEIACLNLDFFWIRK